MVDPLDIYRFDLKGYLLLEGALTSDEVAELNAGVDAIPYKNMNMGDWFGGVHCHSFSDNNGINLQQAYEAGEPFEKLIDHPSWIEHIKTFASGEGSFDQHHGPLFIDENFISIRERGEAIGMHSGGDNWSKRNSYRVYQGKFMVCQVNVLLALTDIGEGDGGTVIIPGSHKQNFKHPHMAEYSMGGGGKKCGDDMPESLEVHMKAGDALIFTDTICHGSAIRNKDGERRIIVYRYGPSWGFFRHPYRPTRELLDRLTPERKQIVWPHEPIRREPNLKPDAEVEPNYSERVSSS